eukprot:Skav203862  [mRNA]  locus=scaffold1031:87413:89822:- [translate_table: standard]
MAHHRKVETIPEQPKIEEELEETDDDFFSSPSSVATPTLRSKETAEMSQLGKCCRVQRSREGEMLVRHNDPMRNLQAHAAAELAEAEEKVKQLKSLADAWEREAREQSKKSTTQICLKQAVNEAIPVGLAFPLFGSPLDCQICNSLLVDSFRTCKAPSVFAEASYQSEGHSTASQAERAR